MADIAPFRPVRFNPDKVAQLAKTLCPPYDVISTIERHQLNESHPNNIVRIELPTAEMHADKYKAAAEIYKQWLAKKILIRDAKPAIFGYEQRFISGGEKLARRGFFVALKLEIPGRGTIRAHEQTFPKHKEDRFQLMKAVKANISPIFGTFLDPKGVAQKYIHERMNREKPLAVLHDVANVTHRLWRWDDRDGIAQCRKFIKGHDVFIADGHHRYETAYTISKTIKSPAAKYVMGFLCPLEDPGLVVWPTHRVVHQERSTEEWKKILHEHFTVQSVATFRELSHRVANAKGPVVGAIFERELFFLKPMPSTLKKASHAFFQGRGRLLPVVPATVLLHAILLADTPLDSITYTRDDREAAHRVQRKEAAAAFLMPPPSKEEIAAVAHAGEVLPQKSTYFFPKLPTGLLVMPIDKQL